MADATQQIQELKARLGAVEGRVRALDDQLTQMESCKKDVEHKLTSVLYTLKRIAGIQFDGTLTAPHRLMSPSRRFSPARSADYGGDCCLVDVDPEMIRKSVRKLMQQIGQIERDKEDYKSQLVAAKKQLEDAGSQQTRCENKLSKLQQALRAANEEKANCEAKLVQKQLALQSVEETLKLKTDDFNLLTDKYKSLESQLNSVAEQRNQLEVRAVSPRQFSNEYEFRCLRRTVWRRVVSTRLIWRRRSAICKKKCRVSIAERPSWTSKGSRSRATSSGCKWLCRTRTI